MKRERFEHIDTLRAASILGVIVIHILSYNLNAPNIFFIWNYLHFVVVTFVLCSGYVLDKHYGNSLSTMRQILPWYRKRITRLLAPFYVYLAAHFALWLLLPDYVSGLGLQTNTHFILSSVLLTGGIDINWLPLLFIQLTLLFPLFVYMVKRKYLLTVYTVLCLLFTGYATYGKIPIDYRFVMWIPWSMILILGMIFSKNEKNEHVTKQLISYGILLGGVLYVFLSLVAHTQHRLIVIANEKYPPNGYYLSYGLALSCILMFIISKTQRLIRPLYSWIRWVSENSYPLFFIHYIVIDVVLHNIPALRHTPSIQVAIIVPLSLLICHLVNTCRGKYRRVK